MLRYLELLRWKNRRPGLSLYNGLTMTVETENERGLECAIVKMALSAQEVELSPDDLPVMRRLTKTVQRYLRVTDIALGKRKSSHRSKADRTGAATAA